MAKSSDFPFLPAGFDLEPDLLDQLSNRPGSQRCVVGRDELLLVVHDVPKPGESAREAIVFWRRTEGHWVDSTCSKGLRRLGDLVDRYAAAIEDREDVVDEADTAAEVFALARSAGPLARTSRNLVAAIEQALAQDEDNRELRSLRDRSREVERAADLLYHDARLTLEFWQAERAEEQQEASEKLNRIVFRLNLLAGFFLPLVALGGLFGMNVDLPDFVHGWFWGIFIGGLAFGGALLAVVGWKTGASSK